MFTTFRKVFGLKGLKGFCQMCLNSFPVAFLTLIAWNCLQTAFAATIAVTPSNQAVSLGSIAAVALEITGLGDPPALGTFDLNVSFDSTMLFLNSVAFGDPILGDQLDPTGQGNTLSFFLSSAGTVELFDLSLESASDLNTLQSSNFVLASLSFDVIGVGVSSCSVTINGLGDADGNLLPVSVQNGSISTTSGDVPEPCTGTLMVLGLLVVLRLRRGKAGFDG